MSCPTQSKVKFSPQLHAGFCILTFTWQTRRLSVGLVYWSVEKESKCKRLGNSKAKKNDKIQKQTLRKFSRLITMFYHFTVVCSVTWPWNGSETAGDLVLIQTFSYYFCINQVVLMSGGAFCLRMLRRKYFDVSNRWYAPALRVRKSQNGEQIYRRWN